MCHTFFLLHFIPYFINTLYQSSSVFVFIEVDTFFYSLEDIKFSEHVDACIRCIHLQCLYMRIWSLHAATCIASPHGIMKKRAKKSINRNYKFCFVDDELALLQKRVKKEGKAIACVVSLQSLQSVRKKFKNWTYYTHQRKFVLFQSFFFFFPDRSFKYIPTFHLNHIFFQSYVQQEVFLCVIHLEEMHFHPFIDFHPGACCTVNTKTQKL